MKILLDAQLPKALKSQLEPMGCDVLHTLDLPEGNRSSDRTISSIADHDERVVFSKDLSALLLGVLSELIKLFESHVLIEMNQQALIVSH